MTEFAVHTIESAAGESREMLENLQKKMGMIPNLMGVMAESPVTLKSYLALSGALQGSTLTPVEREIVLLTVSDVNDCKYCLAAHSTMALKMKMPPEVLGALRERRSLADARLEALRSFTRDLVQKAGRLDQARVDQFLAAGFTREQLLEVITAMTLMTLTNTINHLVDPPIDPVFAGQSWTAAS